MLPTGTRVLIVEDEALLSMMVEDYLEEIGCEIMGTASRLEAALEKAGTLSLDVAVLDVNLAGKLSYSVAEVLYSRNIPYLFMTGYGMAGMPDSMRDATVVSKPFELGRLNEALCTVMGKF
jgi:DNA-binding NarL/FixJ family response regulator